MKKMEALLGVILGLLIKEQAYILSSQKTIKFFT